MKVIRFLKFVDVFTGEGWEDWSRYIYRKTPYGLRLVHVKGQVLSNNILSQIK